MLLFLLLILLTAIITAFYIYVEKQLKDLYNESDTKKRQKSNC